MFKKFTAPMSLLAIFAMMILGISPAFASEADLVVPSIKEFSPEGYSLLMIGLGICVIGLIFGLVEFLKIKKLSVHKLMDEVGSTIFETCKTYLIQQGKFLLVLEVLIGLCIAFYFGYLQHMGLCGVLTILGWSVIGILGSYAVAWFGIRMNTLANSRTAFTALKGNPLTS
jgi:K(+)-stimulated pyrophosphate-energized sodium pump